MLDGAANNLYLKRSGSCILINLNIPPLHPVDYSPGYWPHCPGHWEDYFLVSVLLLMQHKNHPVLCKPWQSFSVKSSGALSMPHHSTLMLPEGTCLSLARHTSHPAQY